MPPHDNDDYATTYDDDDYDYDNNDDHDDIFSPALPLPMTTQSVWSAFPVKEHLSNLILI